MECKCANCEKEYNWVCRCGSYWCDEGYLTVLCGEDCYNKYNDGIMRKAKKLEYELSKILSKEQMDLLDDIIEDEVAREYFCRLMA